MVGMDQIKRGVARYLDEEFTSKLSGWQKWVFGAGAAMYLENLDAVAQRVRELPLVQGLGLMDAAGNVDLEKLRKHFLAEAQKGAVSFSAPMLGTVKLDQGDIEKLYRCILES